MAEYKGRHVKITLENGHVFEGFVHSTNETTHKLTLEKVTDCNTKTRVKGLQHFFAHEMESIEALEDQIRPKTPENDTIMQDKREQGPKVIHSKYTPSHLDRMGNFQPTMRMLKTMSSVDEENTEENGTKVKNSDGDSNSDQDLGQSDEDYIVISKLDHKFDQAIHYITRYGVIGVAMEGVCIGRSGTLCWLQIGTNDHTFLFDILTMGPECFEAGLKGILEDTNILKVMHDCRLPSDILHHQYQVSLVNVFDTQVADVFVYRLYHGNDWPRYVQGLPACLFDHLNLAQEQIHNMKVRHHLKKEDQEVWQKRPLPRSLLDAAAKNVKHLRELRIVLTEKMMAEYVAGVDVYLSHIKNASKDDARKHQANPQLLPLGFRDLNSVMMTSRDFYFMNREKTVPKDSSGFRENCTGVGDPDVVFSRDSIWHTGQRKRGSVYFNQYQKLMSGKETTSSEAKCEDKVLPKPTTDDKNTTVQATDTIAINPKVPTDVETSAETGGEDQPHISQTQGDIESLSVTNIDNDIKKNPAQELAITGDLKELLDGSIKTAGRRMRELMSKDKFFNTGGDSLENFEIRPAGTWQVSGKSKRKNSEKSVRDIPDHNSNMFSAYNAEMSPSSSVIDTPDDLQCDMLQDSIRQFSESRTESLDKVTPCAECASSGSDENSGNLTSGSDTEHLGHSLSNSHLHKQKHSPPSPRAVHSEPSVFSDSESCFSGKISPQLTALGRGRGMTFSPRTNDSIRTVNNHQGNIPYSCAESKVRKPGNPSMQNVSASQAKTWGTFIQNSSSETLNNDETMEEKVSPILKLNSGLHNGNSKLTNLRLILGACQNTKE